MTADSLREDSRILWLKTGVAMVHCRKALMMFDGCLHTTEEYLNTGAWKAGKLITYCRDDKGDLIYDY